MQTVEFGDLRPAPVQQPDRAPGVMQDVVKLTADGGQPCHIGLRVRLQCVTQGGQYGNLIDPCRDNSRRFRHAGIGERESELADRPVADAQDREMEQGFLAGHIEIERARRDMRGTRNVHHLRAFDAHAGEAGNGGVGNVLEAIFGFPAHYISLVFFLLFLHFSGTFHETLLLRRRCGEAHAGPSRPSPLYMSLNNYI